MTTIRTFLLLGLTLRWAAADDRAVFPVKQVLDLPPAPGNPRNTEGAFVSLRDGRILFAYTKFTGGGSDHDAATIVARYSRDQGRTWTATDAPLVGREGQMNAMSVSLLRLQDGRIALFYLRKNSLADCHPYLRYSSDEGATWTEAVSTIAEPGYYVLNNDRVVQLRGGRLVMPVALHAPIDGKFSTRGVAMTYLSDDAGRTWRRTLVAEPPMEEGAWRAGFQEPGVVELSDGRLLMFIRTQQSSQYLAYSSDQGTTWSVPQPSPIASPLSPASIKRLPGKGGLLMVWNDHASAPEPVRATAKSGGKRTPLTVAISTDDGKTWSKRHDIRNAPDGWYCYTAIHFVKDQVLLGFASGGSGLPGLSRMELVRFRWRDLR
ncbi:MAG: glycoside hydrolase [Bryobacteraceae bacterium]|nr:glycoside hydrolase [Bryobacteraceae bacterium]